MKKARQSWGQVELEWHFEVPWVPVISQGGQRHGGATQSLLKHTPTF